jgi:hypothetical protein
MSVSAAAISAVVLIAPLRPAILDRDNAVTSPAQALVPWEEPRRRRGRAYLQLLGAVVHSRANAAGSSSEADDSQL